MRTFAQPAGLLALTALSLATAVSARAQAVETDHILTRINELRRQAGAEPLARHEALDEAARRHTEDMARSGQLMHVSPTSGTPIDRTRAAGLSSTEVAENVAMHSSAERAQRALEASDAHLANMLNPRFTHVGLAAVRDAAGVYVTQVFARIEPATDATSVAPSPAPTDSLSEPSSPAESGGQSPPVASPLVPEPVVPPPPGASSPSLTPEPTTPSLLGTPDPGRRPEVDAQPAMPGQVVAAQSPEGVTLGYWVCASERWWFYPLPAGFSAGRLEADLTVTGAPPGFGACAAGATPPVVRAPTSVPAPGAYGPAGGPRGAYGAWQYAAPAPTYHRPRIVVPGTVVMPWGGMHAPGPRLHGRRVIVWP